MMFGCEFGPNAEKYTTRMSASLPNGSTLQFTTVSARPFTVAFSLKREGSIVNAVVVVHSREYNNLNLVVGSVINQFHKFVDGNADALHVVICLGRKLYVALAEEPRCLSCFDVQGYINSKGRRFPAVCTACKNDEVKLSVDPDGTCSMSIDTALCQQKDANLLCERQLDDFEPCEKKCHTCSNKASKHCVCGAVRYCSKECQVSDWGRHRKAEHGECKAHKNQELLAAELLRNGYSISSLLLQNIYIQIMLTIGRIPQQNRQKSKECRRQQWYFRICKIKVSNILLS
jgi:hypothetical protein